MQTHWPVSLLFNNTEHNHDWWGIGRSLFQPIAVCYINNDIVNNTISCPKDEM